MADGHITGTVDPVMVAMAQALAAIDAALGLPEDGCNSTTRTLEAIRALKSAVFADVHSCHPGCSRAGCVNERLRVENEDLRHAIDRACAPVERTVRTPFPMGCTIRNIRRGEGYRSRWVYACLYGPDDKLLIAATLEYINAQMIAAGTAA